MVATLEGYDLVCKVSEMPPRGKKKLSVSGIDILIIACESGYYAIQDRCPQTARPISHGKVLNCQLTSPHTGAHYDLRTGKYVGGGQSPLQSHWLTVLPLRVVDEDIYVQVTR